MASAADDEQLAPPDGGGAADPASPAPGEGVFKLTSTQATNDALAPSEPPAPPAGSGANAVAAGGAAGLRETSLGLGTATTDELGSGADGAGRGPAGGTAASPPPGGRAGRAGKASAAGRFAAVVNETASKARVAVDEGTEEHWNHVMKKLAPQGYQKTPVWQRRILERVLKRMSTREQDRAAKPLTEKLSMSANDLALSALSPDAGNPLGKSVPMPREQKKPPPKPVSATQASIRKRAMQRQNKIHYYTRAFQMEQLLGQDLDADLRHMQQEVALTLKESRGGEARAAEELVRQARKEKALATRLQVLVEKANALEASNAELIHVINDLRSERALVLSQVRKMSEKDGKMDEDMAFLAQAAHSALDQREKVKVKLQQTQRDSGLEKAHRLSQLAELMAKADTLDSEYDHKLASIDESEQARRRRQYALGKQRRLAQLQAETKAGFLQSQVVGWDSEFARLQEFTGMDKRFAPGDDQTIEEITSRYLSKDQQNTSLLRYLHAQQVELQGLEAELKGTQETARTLERQLQVALESDAAPVMDFDGLAQAEAEAAYRIEAQLADLCDKVAAITELLAPRSTRALPADGACSVANLEEHLQLHEDVTAQLHAHWRQRYLSTKVRTQEALYEWVQPKPPKAYESIDEIYDRLVMAANNAVQLGADDDEEEMERRAEQKSAFTPFSRRKVNKNKERMQIQEWARRRQPGQSPYGTQAALPPPPGSGGSAAGSARGAATGGSPVAGTSGTATATRGGTAGGSKPATAERTGRAPAEGTMVYVIGGQ